MNKNRLFLLLLTLLATLLLLSCGEDEKETITGNIDTTDTGAGMVHPAGLLYVLNQGDGTIYIYDSRTLKRIDSLPSQVAMPHYIEFAPDRKNFYITTLEWSGHIAKFDAVADTFIAQLSTPPTVQPTALAITADSKFGYVCNFFGTSGNQIYKYDLDLFQQVSTIQSGQITHDAKITSDGKIVIATNRDNDCAQLVYTDADTVAHIGMDPDTLQFPNISKKYGPFGVIIGPNDSLAYIACMFSSEIRVLDIAARTIIDSIKVPVDTTGFVYGPTLMAITPDGKRLFVTTGDANSVVALQTSPLSVAKDIQLSTSNSFGIDISDDGSRVYVAAIGDPREHGRIYIIDGTTFIKLDSIDVGNQSYGLRWQSPRP